METGLRALVLQPPQLACTRCRRSQSSVTCALPAHRGSSALESSSKRRRAAPVPRARVEYEEKLWLNCVGPICQLVAEEHDQQEAILCQRMKAHSASLTASLILDREGGSKEFITSSLDNTVALWRLEAADEAEALCCSSAQEMQRLTPSGAPVFSLVQDGEALGASHSQVFMGDAARNIVAWEPPSSDLVPNVALEGHTGWVKALATSGRWLFSCGCNVLRQYDMARAVPRHVRDVKLFTGDIQALATGGSKVFSCGADGSIRSWEIGKGGELSEASGQDRAHRERVSAMLHHAGFLYTASYDGDLKQWDAATLELVAEAPGAHDGERIFCLALGPGNILYTGGNDKLVRRWRAGLLTPAAPPLHCHSYPVRTLASDRHSMLLSGDSSGEVAIWAV